jgi:hypothetical protein
MASRRVSLGNVSTQPFGLEDDETQERLRLSFLSYLRGSVRGCGSVTQDGKQRSNEQMCFAVAPFPNVSFSVVKVSSMLQSKWPQCTIEMKEGELVCMLPCARRNTGPNHIAYRFTYVAGHLAVMGTCAVLLYILPKGTCFM